MFKKLLYNTCFACLWYNEFYIFAAKLGRI